MAQIILVSLGPQGQTIERLNDDASRRYAAELAVSSTQYHWLLY